MRAVTKHSLIIVAVCAIAVVGCSGEKKAVAPTTPPDPGRDVLAAFVDAAAAGDSEAMWDLLSKPSQRRAGPTIEAFEQKTMPGLRRELAPFAKGELPIQVSESLDGRFGLVALSRGSDAYAVPLRHEGNVWRVELPGPLRIQVLGPPPGSRGKFVNQIGVETHGPGGSGLALLYIDGTTLDVRTYAGPRAATIFANFANKLEPGTHTAVAFSSNGRDAAARAWTFVP